MSLSKSNLNILSSYAENWNFRSYKPLWSYMLFSDFIGDLRMEIDQIFADEHIVDSYNNLLNLVSDLADEFLYKNYAN